MPQTRRNRSRGDRNLVRIRRSRRKSRRTAPIRSERTRARSDERTWHRCPARDRRSEIAARLITCTQALEGFFWFAHVAGASFKACVFLQECEGNFADGAVALFSNDQLGFAGLFHARFFVFLVQLRPNE